MRDTEVAIIQKYQTTKSQWRAIEDWFDEGWENYNDLICKLAAEK